MEALISILSYYPNKKVILFCNHREAVDRISDYLEKKRIFHGTFHGGMEQQDRERNLLKYRHGSIQILVCTDLAARGLDVPAIDVVVHYQVPRKEADFTHRNGRTARMEKEGEVWVLLSEKEFQPDYVEVISSFSVPKDLNLPPNPVLTTLFISGGKRDKISKFDLVGTFYKAGNLEKEDLGMVQVLKEYSLVTVKSSKAKMLISKLNNTRIKKRKVRVSLAE
ncbi:MAG: helicase-related protein [Flavobacteriales bacterium]|nr:helicase-related protein [Flavobacteriales bacterium]